MPSFRTVMAPTIIHSPKSSLASLASSTSSKKERAVGFLKDPVMDVSRPVNTAESWATYNFEMHARNCAYCHDPYEVHRSHEQLCDVGHRLAQEVASFIYNRSDGKTYSRSEEDHKLVRVEIPAGYVEVSGLLRAMERSIRRSRTPFVSMDRTYHISTRVPSVRRARSVKVEQTVKTKARPHSGEIVNWPESPKLPKPRALAEISVNNAAVSKRGSLYEQDQANERRKAKTYRVEVREPSLRDVREHRLSGYYR